MKEDQKEQSNECLSCKDNNKTTCTEHKKASV